MGETPLGQHMVLDQQHVGPTVVLSQNESSLPGADGMEEHLEGEDSAVKDLEDVEVKDLVDLNLNLDPEDGMKTLMILLCHHLTVCDSVPPVGLVTTHVGNISPVCFR